MSNDASATTSSPRIASAEQARRAASMMNYGNLLAILVPVPFLILWFGGSMLVYAMNRHHPNPRVGHYTQQAAYRFYGIVGFFTAAAMFIPASDARLIYALCWGLAALVLVPWSILDLVRIRRERWQDTPIEDHHR